MTRKSGSALLIVLGFLAFMVVSAVAFSIYMRSERVPSSVYRRGVQSRQLVKAALARVMSELDDSIRSDPFPGIVDSASSRRIQGNVENIPQGSSVRFADQWYGRVFMPPNPDIQLNGKYDGSLQAPLDETVSVVTLEGLGYLPPNLINDVRFLARSSWSSKWRMFNYGCGRYAYCAVNVSDYPDIVRVVANAARSSSSPVNLSSLFADDFKSQSEGVSEAKQLFDFIDKRGNRGGVQSTWPFVSMLDYALAMGNQTIAGVDSPFYRWCKGGRSTMYDPATYTALKQPFVTDSWLPDSALDVRYASSIVDLNNRQENSNGGQPFPVKSWMEGGKSFTDIENVDSQFLRRVASGKTPDGKVGQGKSFLEATYAVLYDYLDRDDMPLSLALPCTERTPMVTAIEAPDVNFQMAVTANQQPTVPSGGGNSPLVEITETYYEFDPTKWDESLKVKVAFAFPFKRGQALNRNFKARVFCRLFLVENGAQGLRISKKSLRPDTDQNGNDWNNPTAFAISGGSSGLVPLVFPFVSSAETIAPPTDIEQQADAVFEKDFTLKSASMSNQRLISKREVKTTPVAVNGVQSPSTTSTEWKFDATHLKTDGSLAIETSDYEEDSKFKSRWASLNITLQAAVWVLIEDANGDVVDLVPAIAADDSLYNNVNNGTFDGYRFDGNDYPLFRFKSSLSQQMTGTPDQFFNIQSIGIDSPKSYYVVDPRYNWAPEDWLPRNKEVSGESWYKWVTGINVDNKTDELLGTDGRDSDIFMFVSNQGFLQSMGEMAFLPHVSSLGNQSVANPATPVDWLAKGNSYDGVEHKTSDDWTVIPNRECVWRTFRPYAENDGTSEFLMNFRNVFGSVKPHAFKDFGARGFRVNPYTDNENILFTAFAYTPYDWWAAAGTNALDCTASNSKDSFGSRKSMFEDLNNSRKYTFYEGSSEAPLRDEDIRNIARNINSEIRSQSGKDWQEVYDGLDWYGAVQPDRENTFQNFLGVNCNDSYFHSVDRKFLYAFWRNCLANRQQLFLVFLRAESMALGGSGEGQIPPQQGGHAVALIWRDPENPINSSGTTINQDGNTRAEDWVPHRMRLLFFHQFD